MKKCLTSSLRLLGLSFLLCCVIYPVAIFSAGQLFFPFQSNGSLLKNELNQPVASVWIAQSFKNPEFFHPRPSATNYNTMPGSSSCLAPSSPALRDRIGTTLTKLKKFDPLEKPVPADAVMTSASGLDPYISYENATRQLPRVSKEWAQKRHEDPEKMSRETAALLEQNTVSPLVGWAGGRIVNVITLNWKLYKHFMVGSHE